MASADCPCYGQNSCCPGDNPGNCPKPPRVLFLDMVPTGPHVPLNEVHDFLVENATEFFTWQIQNPNYGTPSPNCGICNWIATTRTPFTYLQIVNGVIVGTHPGYLPSSHQINMVCNNSTLLCVTPPRQSWKLRGCSAVQFAAYNSCGFAFAGSQGDPCCWEFSFCPDTCNPFSWSGLVNVPSFPFADPACNTRQYLVSIHE